MSASSAAWSACVKFANTACLHRSREASVQPDVSFVIAAYNAAATLDRAIAGAIAQRGVGVEIIVVDDQSRDNTLEVARAYPQDIVRVVALTANRGPGAARNAGL